MIPILLDGLKRLEYRGYDSAGLAWQDSDCLKVIKTPGKLDCLQGQLSSSMAVNGAVCGIGHTIKLFAYEMAVALGTDVDQPRKLAKSVTVE